MKAIFLLSICLLLVNCIGERKIKTKTLDVQAITYSGNGKEDSIRLELCNNTDTIVKFWNMSCSWDFNWIFENDSVHIKGLDCNSNVLVKDTLKPGKILTFNGAMDLPDTMQLSYFKSGSHKVGFVLIRENEIKNFRDFLRILEYKISNKKDIIWGPVY